MLQLIDIANYKYTNLHLFSIIRDYLDNNKKVFFYNESQSVITDHFIPCTVNGERVIKQLTIYNWKEANPV